MAEISTPEIVNRRLTGHLGRESSAANGTVAMEQSSVIDKNGIREEFRRS